MLQQSAVVKVIATGVPAAADVVVRHVDLEVGEVCVEGQSDVSAHLSQLHLLVPVDSSILLEVAVAMPRVSVSVSNLRVACPRQGPP